MLSITVVHCIRLAGDESKIRLKPKQNKKKTMVFVNLNTETKFTIFIHCILAVHVKPCLMKKKEKEKRKK